MEETRMCALAMGNKLSVQTDEALRTEKHGGSVPDHQHITGTLSSQRCCSAPGGKVPSVDPAIQSSGTGCAAMVVVCTSDWCDS